MKYDYRTIYIISSKMENFQRLGSRDLIPYLMKGFLMFG